MKISCGILIYKIENNELYFFLVHPGGPFFAKKDFGFWSIPKGELKNNEQPIDCALRELLEETRIDLRHSKENLLSLGDVVQKNNKKVFAWAINNSLNNIVDGEGFVDLSSVSNKIEIRLGVKIFEVPEVDKGQFFKFDIAVQKINPQQVAFLELLQKKMGSASRNPSLT
jgi:predicted NUDIX family NTP pyrophosphohydrolase